MADPLRTFRRSSVIEQTAEVLTEAIQRGEMTNPLPSELQLAEKLKVSRPTLRRALAILAKRNLVATAKGKRTRLVARDETEEAPRPQNRAGSVCFVVSASYHPTTLLMNPIFTEMKFQLTAEGIAWDAIYESKLGGRKTTARLAEIVSGRRDTCYVLFSPAKPLQRWFMESGLPVLILGSCYEGVDLPSIDIDYRAVGWHAAGQLIKNGHKRILLVKPSWAHPMGNTTTEKALRDYLEQTENARLQVLQVAPDPNEFLPSLERALRGPKAPTAIIACRVEIALSLLGSVQLFGKSIPKDVSLISRDHYPILEAMTPQVTRYASNLPSFARKAVRFIHALLQGNVPRRKTVLISPEFVPGQTLRPI